MYGFDLAGIESALYWYANGYRVGIGKSDGSNGPIWALQSQKVVPFIHSLFQGEHV